MGNFDDGTVLKITNYINIFYLVYNYMFLFYATNNIYPNVSCIIYYKE